MRSTLAKTDPTTAVRRFEKTIKLPEHKPKKLIVIGPAGPSCVGKTTTMKFIAAHLPYFVRIANDDIRIFLRNSGFGVKETEKFIYENIPSYHLAEKFLKRGYCVIIDANFATFNTKKINKLLRGINKFGAKFFLIRVMAPSTFIKRKLQNKRFIKSGLLPNWKVAWQHFLRSSRQFNYKKLGKYYIAKVDTSKPIAPQLRGAIDFLREATVPR